MTDAASPSNADDELVSSDDPAGAEVNTIDNVSYYWQTRQSVHKA